MSAVEDFAKKKSPFPVPCSFRTALSHYVDISSPPHIHVLREMIHYTSDPAVRTTPKKRRRRRRRRRRRKIL